MKQKRKQKKQNLSDKLFKLSDDLDANKGKLIKLQLTLIKKLIGVIVIYGFLSAIFLGIYTVGGFEKTIVLLGVSIMFWGIKQNYNNLKKIVELEARVANGNKGRNDKKSK